MNNVFKLNQKSNPISELKAVRDQIKALQDLETSLKGQINNLLDQAGIEELVIDGDKVARTLTERKSFDSGAFKAAHPELYGKFQKVQAIITLKTI